MFDNGSVAWFSMSTSYQQQQPRISSWLICLQWASPFVFISPPRIPLVNNLDLTSLPFCHNSQVVDIVFWKRSFNSSNVPKTFGFWSSIISASTLSGSLNVNLFLLVYLSELLHRFHVHTYVLIATFQVLAIYHLASSKHD